MRKPRKALACLLLAALATGTASAPARAAPIPKVALLVAGIGYAEAPDHAVIRDLPAQVGLILSPYGAHAGDEAQEALAARHELLMGIPLETRDNPLTSEGAKALVPDEERAINRKSLDWVLSRASGYDGAADVIGIADNSAFMNYPEDAAWLGRQLSRRHLFFIELRGGRAMPGVPERRADTVILPDQGDAGVTAGLNRLIAQARAHGTALGVVLEPAPAAIPLLAAWCRGLNARGVALVPARALIPGRVEAP